MECAIGFVFLIVLFKIVDQELKEAQVLQIWEGVWFVVKQAIVIGHVFLSGRLYKELIKNKNEIVIECQTVKRRLKVNVWFPFKKNIKKKRFWAIQVFNIVKIQHFYFGCVLKAIAWLWVMAMIKQGLIVNGVNVSERETLFTGILTTIYSFLVALMAVRIFHAIKEVTLERNLPSWKCRKQLIHWIIVMGLFTKYNVFTLTTYDSISRQSNLLEMLEPYYFTGINFGLLSLILFLMRKRFRLAINYVELLPGKPLIQSEFGEMFHVQEKWKEFLYLFSLSETYYGDVSYQKQVIKDEYIDPRVPKEQVVTLSIRYSPFKETFVVRSPIFATMVVQGSLIGYAVGRKEENLNKKASEAL